MSDVPHRSGPIDRLRDVKLRTSRSPSHAWPSGSSSWPSLADFAYIVAINPNFGWPVVAQYLFDPTVMQGLWVTLGLTVVAMVIGVVLGLVLAIARMSNDRLASIPGQRCSSGSSAERRCSCS